MTDTETCQHKIEIYTVNNVDIGRERYPVKSLNIWVADTSSPCLTFLNALNRPTEDARGLRQMITSFLNGNTAFHDNLLGFERGASAYFTYDPNPDQESIIVEWGKIDQKKGEAKLHDYLRVHIPSTERAKQGMQLCSGHFARLTRYSDYYLAFLERIRMENLQTIQKDDPFGKMINTLYANHFIPLSAEAMVCLPVF